MRKTGSAVTAVVLALGVFGGVVLASFTPHFGLRTSHPQVPTTHGEWIWIKRGTDSIRTYVAYPERRDKAPTMLVIHEIYGLTEWEPTVVDRLAAQGFIAAVPDLLSPRFGITPQSGTPQANADSARKLIAQLAPDAITADLDAVAAYLDALPAARKGDQGAIGFCWGGGETFRYATNNPKLKAAVVCYGPAPDTAALGRIQARVRGVYGENDARINASLPMVDSTMRRLGKHFDQTIYPATGHGFLKPGRVGSDGPQVERAWGDIIGFLRETLGR
jgi:carboxymethylenebutenolidase